jgi:adenylyltransferase/sulfurtransferase
VNLDAERLDRYSRHVIMEEVGPEGQAALLDADVLVVGAGGLGSPAVQYLAAAGVSRLGVADGDVVERSNLQRQVVHRDEDIGRNKAESAAAFVAGLDPGVTVDVIAEDVTPANATELVTEYDLVLDCSDNFRTRYLLNDACVLTDTPLSHGAVYRFEGQVTTVAAGGRPCYRCVFPEAPEPGTIPNCAEVGVLGVLPGTVGCLQATEAVKTVLDIGETLSGRLLLYDALEMSFERVPVRRRPECPVCGDDPVVDSVSEVEYADRCAIAAD